MVGLVCRLAFTCFMVVGRLLVCSVCCVCVLYSVLWFVGVLLARIFVVAVDL